MNELGEYAGGASQQTNDFCEAVSANGANQKQKEWWCTFSRNLEWGKGNHPQSQPHHHHDHGRSWRWHGHTTPSSTWITGGTTLSPSPPHQPPQGPPCSSPHQERLSSFQTLANPSSFPIPASASTTPIASLEKSMSSRSPAATMIPSSTSPPSAATPLPLGKSSLRSTLR